MKTTYLNIMACVLLAAGMALSCKKDSDNNSTDIDQMEVSDGSADSLGEYGTDSTDAQGNSAMGANNAESSGNKARKTEQSTTAVAKEKTGYSAPDGTDAENHDGDPYTKHDTTRMPSGSTSIK